MSWLSVHKVKRFEELFIEKLDKIEHELEQLKYCGDQIKAWSRLATEHSVTLLNHIRDIKQAVSEKTKTKTV